MQPVEIWLAHEMFDEENFREAAWHARNGRTVLLHGHCHAGTCADPPGRPHRHQPCAGSRHWRHAPPGLLELPAGRLVP